MLRDPWKEQFFGPFVYSGKVYPRPYDKLDEIIDKLNGVVVAEKQQHGNKSCQPD